MTSQNNKKGNMLQNIQYCVLIDGDFGRHELFSDIHPFTLNRLENEEQTMEFLNKTSDIHYHIYYNSEFPEIVEYYQVLKMFYHTNIFLHPSLTKTTNRYFDFTEILTKYKYNYFWIIHGTENNCEELVNFLQSNTNIQADISHYSWLENLGNASNRIEYLFKYKTNDQPTNAEVKCTSNTSEKESITLNVHRLEESPTETELIQNQKTTVIEKPNNITTAKKTTISCGFNDCKKVFATIDALKTHQTAKNHVTDETNISTLTPVITKKPNDVTTTQKTTISCGFHDCKKVFATTDALKTHQTAKNHITEETNISTLTPVITKKPNDVTAAQKTIIIENSNNVTTAQKTRTRTIEKPKDTTKGAKKKTIQCGFDGCKKVFATTDSLNAHQKAKKHRNKTTNTTTRTLNLDDFRDEFATIANLKSDETTNEYINDETDSSRSTSVIEESNITTDSKTTTMTFNSNDYRDVFAAINGLKSDETTSEYINDETDSSTSTSIIEEEKESNVTADSKMTTTMTFNLKAYRDDNLKSTKKQIMQCNFGNCNRSFTKLQKLKKHQVNTHPIPLRCLYTVECCNSNEIYLGKDNLESHVESQHASLLPSLRCPVVTCSHAKLFKTWEAKLTHDIRIHNSYLLACEVSAPTVASISTWDTSGPFTCSNKDCEQFYWEEESLKRHEAFEHRVDFQCPYSLECQQKRKKYVGRGVLLRHITTVHAPEFPEPTCFDPSCQFKLQNWNKIVYHLLEKHLDAIGLIKTTSPISSTSTKEKAKKCSYGNCNEIFRNRKSFLTHLILVHPHPLRCPYNSNCNKTPILGLPGLKQHIETDHSTQFIEPKCFHTKCQEEKHFSDWKTVLDHIVQMHFPDIKSN